MCFKNIATQVCVVLKSVLSKAIARCRAKNDATRIEKWDEAVRKISFDVV